ncbi:MAG: hypothetical protein IT270_12140 [Saprospiraceae bacterium]|nr:hypothetical protein [Saprospiraceae bacterium]
MRALAILFLLFPGLLRAQETPAETPERLRWTIDQAAIIEKSLRAATLSSEYNLLLRNLTNADKQFALVYNADIQCDEVRPAAERGRKWCNPFDVKAEADMNGLIERATKARLEAIRIHDAAGFCLDAVTPLSEQPDLTSAEVFASIDDIVRKDINYGLRSGDDKILTFDLEHAIRLLNDVERMASTIDGCIAYREAAQKAIQSCTAALLSSTWSEIEKHCLTALGHLDVMDAEAKCR